MGTRGRKTDADKAMLAQRKITDANGQTVAAPPTHLSEAAAKEWSDIVATYPADRFPRSTWPMLEAYCMHAVNVRRIGKRLNEADDDILVRDWNQLLSMLNRETKTLASFGVRLGIARTSMAGRHNHDPDQTHDGTPAPWEDA